MPLSCRFYAQKFPEIEDVVMVTVREIAEMGAYVDLLEYNNIEGMILFSELSRRRIRSINKLIRVGKTEPVVVMRVDSEKGYIDLSKRRVTAENIEQCTEVFSKAKAVYSILRHVAGLLKYETDTEFEELYSKTAWYFEAKSKKRGTAYDIFKQAVNDPTILDECGLDEDTKQVLLSQIIHKLTLQSVKIRSDIEVACYGYEGIDAVKAALQMGLDYSRNDMPIKINLIAPPLYVMTTNTPEKQDGLKLLEAANEAIKNSIHSQGGKFEIKMAPKIVTDIDEVDLQKQMDNAEAETRQVAGDDEESGSGSEDNESGEADGVEK